MYNLEKLNYSYDALEPYIDGRTVVIHHDKHHQNYLNKTNALLLQNNYDMKYELEELVHHMDLFKEEDREAIMFNLGGVLNHNLYFKILSPSQHIMPVGLIKEAIDESFGDFSNFVESFKQVANAFMGSGWVFLVLNNDKKLEIVKMSNQETPYTKGYVPLIALDLWEHSYYLKYQNLRTDYINNFFNVIDFEVVNKLYEESI